jgi:protoporphyrinogen oxidase
MDDAGPPQGTAVILGGGPAGLAAGLALTRAGWSVDVVEQASVVGGLARTVVHDGFRFDIGGHRWFTKNDSLNLFLINLLGDELVMVDRISRIFFDGRYVDYPLRAGNVLSRVGPVTSVRAIGDFVVSKASQRLTHKPVISMEDAYVAKFGRTLYELFFRDYSEKVWGQACSALSGDWVDQRSKNLSLFTAMREAVKRSDNSVESLVDRFMYPALGFGRISERMAEQIEQNGGRVHLGSRVIGVNHVRGRVSRVCTDDGRRQQEFAGDMFISSIPMTELAGCLVPRTDAAVLQSAASLTYRDLITVHLLVDRPRVTNDTWVYIHDPSVSFARLHEPRNWSPRMSPDGKTSLVLELFCDVGDGMWQRSDAELIDMVIRDLADRLEFLRPRQVSDGFVVRSKDAYPRYSLGYADAVACIKSYLAGLENLAVVGRGGTFRYNNTDHAIETGLLAARRALGESVDMESVNADRAYLEERPAPAGRAWNPQPAASTH